MWWKSLVVEVHLWVQCWCLLILFMSGSTFVGTMLMSVDTVYVWKYICGYNVDVCWYCLCLEVHLWVQCWCLLILFMSGSTFVGTMLMSVDTVYVWKYVCGYNVDVCWYCLCLEVHLWVQCWCLLILFMSGSTFVGTMLMSVDTVYVWKYICGYNVDVCWYCLCLEVHLWVQFWCLLILFMSGSTFVGTMLMSVDTVYVWKYICGYNVDVCWYCLCLEVHLWVQCWCLLILFMSGSTFVCHCCHLWIFSIAEQDLNQWGKMLQLCNIFFHWPRPRLATDWKQALDIGFCEHWQSFIRWYSILNNMIQYNGISHTS